MIRVIIERKIRKGKSLEFRELVSELRSKAIEQPGHVAGETWVGDTDNDVSIIISTWIGIELWRAWEESVERKRLVDRMEPLLSAPTKVRILRPAGEIGWNIQATPPKPKREARVLTCS